MADISQHIIPNSADFCLLDCKEAFEGLTDREKKYAHYLARASWYGGLIVLYQTSPESPGIYLLLTKLFKHETVDELRKTAKSCGVSDEEYDAILMYTSAIYSNTANYKSFGDTKIIPNLPKEQFEKVVKSSKAYKKDTDCMSNLWNDVSGPMYSLTAREVQLGLGPDGTTCYFSSNCTKQDADIVKQFMVDKDVPMWNSRCLKHDSGKYEIRLASSEKSNSEDRLKFLGDHTHTDSDNVERQFCVTRGDYSQLLALVCESLSKAKEFAANDNQKMMLESYVKSFVSGSNDDHKDGSRYWIKDKGPIVESYIGFIETYRDPVSARAEFEGFVAMVNKEMSAKFTKLVDNARKYLPLLPWSAEFEKDTFLQPDFTSLDVLAFSGSGIPAGINIPNYDEIRQSEGFKNVSLGNVLSSGYKGDKNMTFLSESDKEGLAEWKASSFEVQVGLHELLGHGSGKLFSKKADGSFNFDNDSVKNPLTGELIKSFYENSETYYSKFSTMSSSYEECRAECVGLLLCLDKDVLSVFGHTGDNANKVIYYNWLNMVRAGLLSLEFYSPDTNTWRQAHMQARYVILHVLLEAGGLVTIKECKSSDEKPDLLITLDESKIDTVGRKAISDFLLKLQVYKATADYDSAKAMYQDKYSQMLNTDTLKFSNWRQIVLDRKVPRKMFVQVNTFIKGDSVELKEYKPSASGCIQSVTERYQEDTTLDEVLMDLWKADKHFW